MKKIICTLLLLSVFLGGCSKPAVRYDRQIFAMDTIMNLQVWGTDGEKALDEIQEDIQSLEGRLSVTREKSCVAALNRGEEAVFTPQELDMLRQVLDYSRDTGVLDPCLYPVTSLWGFTTGQYRIPEEAEILEALAKTGPENLILEGSSVTLASGAQLDLGAAVKGWAGQRCADCLKKYPDLSAGLFYLGGNIQTYGEKPDGSSWNIGIQDPWEGDVLGIVHLKGTWSVVTSGDYQRFFEEEGIRYCHIIDPATGHPAASGLASVTIITQDGLRADCLSTALYILGLEQGAEYWRQHRNFEAVWITQEGQVFVTEGIADSFEGCEFQEVTR